jgi:hypothetical protein
MSLFPKILGGRKCINLYVFPPGDFVTGLMQLPVMASAKWYCELIADFQAHGAWLRKSKMMRVTGLSSADKIRLRCDEL